MWVQIQLSRFCSWWKYITLYFYKKDDYDDGDDDDYDGGGGGGDGDMIWPYFEKYIMKIV